MTTAAAAMATIRPPSCGRGPCDELPPPEPVPLPPQNHRVLLSLRKISSRSGGPDRGHLCFHFPRVAARFAASPRVAVLSVITGLIPRHVCAPYLLCGDPRCLSTSEDKAKLLHASDEPPLQTSSFRLRLGGGFLPRSLRCELLRFSQLPPQYDLNDFASRSRIRSTPVLVYRGDASRQSAFVPAD